MDDSSLNLFLGGQSGILELLFKRHDQDPSNHPFPAFLPPKKKNSGHLSSKPRVLGARRGFHPAGLHHVHCTGAESGSMAVFSGVSDAPWS